MRKYAKLMLLTVACLVAGCTAVSSDNSASSDSRLPEISLTSEGPSSI